MHVYIDSSEDDGIDEDIQRYDPRVAADDDSLSQMAQNLIDGDADGKWPTSMWAADALCQPTSEGQVATMVWWFGVDLMRSTASRTSDFVRQFANQGGTEVDAVSHEKKFDKKT